jgi:hypothetical protein
MLATDLIDKLRDLIKQHGDRIVVDEQNNVTGAVFNTDDDSVFLLLFGDSGERLKS